MERNDEGGWYEQNKHIFPLHENVRTRIQLRDFLAGNRKLILISLQQEFLLSKGSTNFSTSKNSWWTNKKSFILLECNILIFTCKYMRPDSAVCRLGSCSMLLTNPFHTIALKNSYWAIKLELRDWRSSAPLCKFYVRSSGGDPPCPLQTSQWALPSMQTKQLLHQGHES